jgi:hypothetical protein
LGYWKKVFINLLRENRYYLDLSSLALDGSYTLTKHRGEPVAFQEKILKQLTNFLFVTDKQGIILSMSTSQAGNHGDALFIIYMK